MTPGVLVMRSDLDEMSEDERRAWRAERPEWADELTMLRRLDPHDPSDMEMIELLFKRGEDPMTFWIKFENLTPPPVQEVD